MKTVPKYIKKNRQLKICLLNVDIDFVESTHCVLENFYDKVVKGGIILFDICLGNKGNKIFYRGETNIIDKFLKKKRNLFAKKFVK